MNDQLDTKTAIARRMRNRIVEYLELVADAELEPPNLKTSDIVNIWEDYVSSEGPEFPSPAFAPTESIALLHFAKAWKYFVDETEPWPVSYAEVFAHPAWPSFREAAASALSVMVHRGLSDED